MAKRRAFGQILTMRSGRFQARYRGPDRQLHNAPHGTFLKRRDAEVWLAFEDRLISMGEWTPPAHRARTAADEAAGLTVGDHLEQVIQRRATRTRYPIRPSTVDRYRQLARIVIVPGLGDVPVRRLTPAMVRSWHEALPAEYPTRNATAYALLRSAMTDAVDAELIESNPCRLKGAGTPSPAREPQALALSELVAYLEAVPEERRLPLALAGWCGLRSGEVRALRAMDVDEDGSMVHVRRTATRVRDGEHRYRWELGAPKTSAGMRSVAVPPHMRVALVARLGEVRDPGQLLWPAGDGQSPLTDSTLRDAHVIGAAAIGRAGLTVHDLRRTAATLAAQQGATTAELMRLLGHRTVQVAMVYQVASEARDRERAERLSAAVAEVSSPQG